MLAERLLTVAVRSGAGCGGGEMLRSATQRELLLFRLIKFVGMFQVNYFVPHMYLTNDPTKICVRGTKKSTIFLSNEKAHISLATRGRKRSHNSGILIKISFMNISQELKKIFQFRTERLRLPVGWICGKL